jgi:hypothetical protein
MYASVQPIQVGLMEGWQSSWDGNDFGRYVYSWPVVSFLPWFIIFMINRMMANHSCFRGHLGRIGIVESPICSRDYETIDHVLWNCKIFVAKRPQFFMDMPLIKFCIFVNKSIKNLFCSVI